MAAMMLTIQCDPDNGNDNPKKDISELTSMELTHQMGAGWNLGNTLDAHWGKAKPWGSDNPVPTWMETQWSNPVTTKAMIDKVKAEGFDTVRIPVTWYVFTGPGPDYKITNAWMNRVQEVVDYVINNGMFCILNTHHEDFLRGNGYQNGWLRLYYTDENDSNPRPLNAAERQEMNRRLGRIWEQIAERFKYYDEYLIFEGLNEPRTEQDLGDVTPEMWADQYRVLNELLQTFVDSVRAGGGKNADRQLMVTPYYAQFDLWDGGNKADLFVDSGTKKLKINDPRDRLIVSLHYYEPWGFVVAPSDSPYFSADFDLTKAVVSGNINNVLKIIETNLVKNGIPVIMGETGAIYREGIAGHDGERVKWAKYYIPQLRKLGVPCVIWDDGGSFRLLDRKNLEWFYPDLAAAFVTAF
jgi:endoglucanase